MGGGAKEGWDEIAGERRRDRGAALRPRQAPAWHPLLQLRCCVSSPLPGTAGRPPCGLPGPLLGAGRRRRRRRPCRCRRPSSSSARRARGGRDPVVTPVTPGCRGAWERPHHGSERLNPEPRGVPRPPRPPHLLLFLPLLHPAGLGRLACFRGVLAVVGVLLLAVCGPRSAGLLLLLIRMRRGTLLLGRCVHRHGLRARPKPRAVGVAEPSLQP